MSSIHAPSRSVRYARRSVPSSNAFMTTRRSRGGTAETHRRSGTANVRWSSSSPCRYRRHRPRAGYRFSSRRCEPRGDFRTTISPPVSRIHPPCHPHPQDGRVEGDRSVEVPHAKPRVSKPRGFRSDPATAIPAKKVHPPHAGLVDPGSNSPYGRGNGTGSLPSAHR